MEIAENIFPIYPNCLNTNDLIANFVLHANVRKMLQVSPIIFLVEIQEEIRYLKKKYLWTEKVTCSEINSFHSENILCVCLPITETTLSSSTKLLCAICKDYFTTPWDLMVHVQAAHMINIYELGTDASNHNLNNNNSAITNNNDTDTSDITMIVNKLNGNANEKQDINMVDECIEQSVTNTTTNNIINPVQTSEIPSSNHVCVIIYHRIHFYCQFFSLLSSFKSHCERNKKQTLYLS